MTYVTAYAVSRAWTTDLEPGTWYEIVPADRPHIIAGFVFAAPGPHGITWDLRAVDGKRVSERDGPGTAGWIAAIVAYRKNKGGTA